MYIINGTKVQQNGKTLKIFLRNTRGITLPKGTVCEWHMIDGGIFHPPNLILPPDYQFNPQHFNGVIADDFSSKEEDDEFSLLESLIVQ